MFKLVALAACCGLVIAVPIALASEGNNTPSQAVPVSSPVDTCDRSAQHQVLHERLALKRWHEPKPLRGSNLDCLSKSHIAKEKARFFRWRTYRKLTPYVGCSGGGKWLRFTAIPGYVVERESGCSWNAVNSSSGACSAYQFIGWTSCDASSWADKMRHHRTARYVLAVQGPGAWAAW